MMWAGVASVAVLGLIFALSGAYVAVEEALEGAMTADLVPEPAVRGTAYGVLGAVNGAGDLLSSLLVGALWQTAGPMAGFAYAAAVMAVGAWVMWRVR
jgi:hypothetical protein